MKTTAILSGNFSTGENAKGNFSGYNSKGERFFIFKQQMEGAGMAETKDVKYPFFALIAEREIETRDDAGELTGIMVKRTQATAVFKTMEECKVASNADAKLEIEIAEDLTTFATSKGFTTEQVNSLLNVSI